MAWALKSELIRQQRGACAAHRIRLEGMDSTESSPEEICSAHDEDSLTRPVSKRDVGEGARVAVGKGAIGKAAMLAVIEQAWRARVASQHCVL